LLRCQDRPPRFSFVKEDPHRNLAVIMKDGRIYKNTL
jgi:hypothetical protein